ncbi:MAG TPA: hybrid sensor histidine kinase/response regulator, partial [Thermopetrobacter sp.]|nr:hybrid sensor histidine kinase/response regulator [Thermopetrobacter sp.]
FSIALAYVGALFLIASLGDRFFRHGRRNRPRPFIYALSLAVYCTTWTFYGSVGLSARSGLDFLPVYIGPVLLLALGWPLLGKVVKISKRQNITSIADFISARYGKHRMLGALVALVAIIGVVPYISLQLKAVSISIETLIPQIAGRPGIDMALIVAIAMAGFAILFGTRHIDATEHQDGLILAVAVESIVKLVAFLAVGVFVVFWQIGGLAALKEQLTTNPAVTSLFLGPPNWTRWVTISLLSLFAFLLLPRQFHVAVVENAHPGDVRKAAFIFPLYLVAINLFVVPIAAAGLTTFGTLVDADTYVLGLPLAAGHGEIAILVFIGGLSAATAMIIIETVALSIMACNNLVVPLLLSRRAAAMPSADMGRVLIIIRRLAIAAILFLAYSYYAMAGASKALAQTGLISFAAVAQFAPAFIGGLLWRRATARGAIAGIVAGFIAWAYTLLLPSFADSGWMSAAILQEGPFGIDWLRPRALFGLAADPLTHGAVWSLGLNVAAWIGVSLFTRPTPAERMQAAAFITHDDDIGGDAAHVPHGTLRIGELQRAVARYLGDKRTARAFADFARRQRRGLDANADADIDLLRHAEHLLASAVGAASSRLILALLLERNAPASRNTLQLLDDASSAIQYNRDLLQSAIDHMRQGLGVYDRHHNLICWNRRFRQLLHLPADMGSIGEPFGDVLRHVLSRALGRQPTERELQRRLSAVLGARKNVLVHFANSDTVLEVRASKLPDGGHVVTFSDITDRVKSEQALQKANEMLERRVEERTAELLRLNHELARAKARA